MARELRKTGIKLVGDVPWGTHFCHFYQTKQDLLDTLVPYFKAGLESKEFCLWVVSDSDLITVEEAKAALAQAVPDLDRHLSEGNIEILKRHDWYFEKNVLNLERVTSAWDERLKQAVARGYDGLRASADTFWLAEKDWKDFFAYEKQVNDWITDQRMTVTCTYPLAKSGAAEVLDVLQAHQFAIARRQGKWEALETPQLIQAKGEIARLNEELEQRVVERTSELRLANEELRKEMIERKQAEEALDERLRFETLVTELSGAFASLSPNQVDREIAKWLQTLVEFLGVDRASFFQFREDGTTLYLGHSYTVPGIEPLSLPPIGIDEQFPWITDQLRRGNTIKWSRIPDDLPEQAAKEKKYAATTGAKSVLNIPVLVSGSVVCSISFTSVGIYCDWADATVARLRLVGEIFAAAVERKRADAERKRTEEALRSGQERYRKLSENFPNGAVITYDTDLRVTFIAGRGLHEAGFSPDFFMGKLLGEIAPPEVVAIAEPHFRAAFGGQIETYEVPYPDGRVYFGAVAPLLNSDGLITEIQVITQDITKPKQAEEALRASEEQFRQLAENIREVFWLATADLSEMLYVSPAYEAVWGKSRESLYREPRSFSAAIHAEDRSRVVAIIERNREQGFEVEYRVVRPDGSIRWIRDRGFPIQDESGRFYRAAGIAEDITERKHAEEALRESEARNRAILKALPDLIFLMTNDGFFMDYYAKSRDDLLVSPELFLGKSVKDVLPPELADGLTRSFREITEASEPIVLEYPLQVGEVHRYFEARVVRFNSDKILCVARNITDRKQAEEKLKQKESQLAEAQRMAHVGSFDWDLRDNSVIWSDELYRIFGVQPGKIEIFGDAKPYIHPEDRDRVWSVVQNSVKNKEPYSLYYRVLREDGDVRILNSRGHVVTDEGGTPVRVFGASQDVTELKRSEEKLQATSERLRALAARFQSAKEEEGTRIARELHDELGSVLTSLKWDLESFDRTISESKDQLRLNMRAKIQAMLRLTENTIGAVRRISFELRPPVLDDLGPVAAIEWQAREFESRTGIPVHSDRRAGKIDLSRAQATAVFRIFQEALTNILRHAQATRVDITIKEEPDEFILTVRDNGRGITEDDKSGSQSFGILGMQERARLIGADIDITGFKGEGTLITLRVPTSE